MADLVTRIIADDKQFNDTINRSKAQVKDFDNGIGIAKAGLLKFAGGLGVVVSAAEVFSRVIEGSQGTSDEFHNTINACKGAVDLFFESLSTGDFSAFQDGISRTIEDLKELSALRDSLSDAKMAMNYNFMKTDPEFMKYETIVKDRSKSKEERTAAYDAAEKLIGDIDKEIAGTVKGARETMLKTLNTKFRNQKFDMNDIDTYLSVGNNNFSSSGVRKASEDYDAKIKDLESKQYTTTNSYGGQFGGNTTTSVENKEITEQIKLLRERNPFLEKQRLLRNDNDSNRQQLYEDATYEFQLMQKKESYQARLARQGNTLMRLDKPEAAPKAPKVSAAPKEKTPELTELEKVQKDYNEGARRAENMLGHGVLSQEEYQKTLSLLTEKTLFSASALDASSEENKAFVDALKVSRDKLKAPIQLPNKGERDSTFDYKKTDMDITSEQLGLEKKYIAELEKIKDKTPEITEALNKATANADGLSNALKIEELKKDIADFEKELEKGLYNNMKGIVSTADRLVGSFKNLTETLEDVDATEWEKLLAIFNALTTAVDGLTSIASAIENVTDLTTKLTTAKKIEEGVDTQKTLTEVANITTRTTAEVTGKATSAAASKTAAAAKGTEALANTGAAATGAASAVASIPIAGPILAIAAIGAVLAAIATIPKFEHGGIVGGSSFTGDRLLARVNSGEAILNTKQQSTLYGMLNNKQGAGGGSVKFKITGRELVGILKQEGNRSERL